ncbi:MAG: hypothetical protein ACYDHD_02635 [Vulcanimicrobiaceae bacterium]
MKNRTTTLTMTFVTLLIASVIINMAWSWTAATRQALTNATIRDGRLRATILLGPTVNTEMHTVNGLLAAATRPTAYATVRDEARNLTTIARASHVTIADLSLDGNAGPVTIEAHGTIDNLLTVLDRLDSVRIPLEPETVTFTAKGHAKNTELAWTGRLVKGRP